MHDLADANERRNERFVVNRFFALMYVLEFLMAMSLTYDTVKDLHGPAFNYALSICFSIHSVIALLFAGLHYVSLLHVNTSQTSVETEQ